MPDPVIHGTFCALPLAGGFCANAGRVLAGGGDVFDQSPMRISARFGNPRHAHVNIGDFIPCGIVGDAGLGQIENSLEGAHCLRGSGTIDAVRGDGGDGGIISGDAV